MFKIHIKDKSSQAHTISENKPEGEDCQAMYTDQSMSLFRLLNQSNTQC